MSVNVPDRRTVILRGRLNLQVMFVVESLLSNDLTGYYVDKDKEYGYRYEDIKGVSRLIFQDGTISGINSSVSSEGLIPKIHCIRYLGNGHNKLRSFLLSDDASFSPVYTNLIKYSNKLSDKQWFRLFGMANSVVDYEMCKLEQGELQFDFDYDCDIDVDGRKIIYMLLSECFLTPKGYKRVLILPDISCLYPDVQLKLLSVLDNIGGHMITLSSARLQPADLIDDKDMILINV